jgi:hypothetical protein
MRVIVFFIKAVVTIGLAIGVIFGLARLHDGPIGLIPGGALEDGQLVTQPVSDWEFAEDIETIELQLEADDTSRTTWILVHNGRAYIPCSLGFPPGKDWHLRADRDGNAIVRIEGKRYPVNLKRLEESSVEPTLVSIVETKYGGAPPSDSGVWFFSVRSRNP